MKDYLRKNMSCVYMLFLLLLLFKSFVVILILFNVFIYNLMYGLGVMYFLKLWWLFIIFIVESVIIFRINICKILN